MKISVLPGLPGVTDALHENDATASLIPMQSIKESIEMTPKYPPTSLPKQEHTKEPDTIVRTARHNSVETRSTGRKNNSHHELPVTFTVMLPHCLTEINRKI